LLGNLDRGPYSRAEFAGGLAGISKDSIDVIHCWDDSRKVWHSAREVECHVLEDL